MDKESLTLLISKLDKGQLTPILKRCVSENKRFRIAGFTNMEKVPPVILSRHLSKNGKMAEVFLSSVVKDFIEEPEDLNNKSINEIKAETTRENRLGIVAHCLLKSEEDFSIYASQLLDEHITEEKPKEVVRTVADTDAIEREKKKTEKYRQKYLEQKKELEASRQEIKTLQARIRELIDACSLKDTQIEKDNTETIALQARVSEMQQEISDLKERSKSPLEKNGPCIKPTNKKATRRLAMRVLAVGCHDALSKFKDVIDIYPEQVLELTKLENELDSYDEVWIVETDVSFSTLRKYVKLQLKTGEKIHIFKNYQELIEYANDICNGG